MTKKTGKPPRIQVYFPGSVELYKALKGDAEKYHVSVSTMALYAIEYGLGYVREHFEEMRSKSIKK